MAAFSEQSSGTSCFTIPIPPPMPKPAKILPASVRHKFVNHSVGSLPTNCATRDNLQDLDSYDEDDVASVNSGLSVNEEEEQVLYTDASALHDLIEAGRRKLPADVNECLTAELSPSETSERSPDELDELDAIAELRLGGQAWLDVESGFVPQSGEPSRHPPVSWLVAAGFIPSGTACKSPFEHTPVAPRGRPSKYLNLFARQLLERERTSDLTVENLARHDQAVGRTRHPEAKQLLRRSGEVPPCAEPADLLQKHGEWLEAFVAAARAAPLEQVASQILVPDLGPSFAQFLDGDANSRAEASDGDEDLPDGTYVVGKCVLQRPVQRGRGRDGFTLQSDSLIRTPGRSQSPAPRPQREAAPLELPQPPLVVPRSEASGQTRRLDYRHER